jgi:hypothetical protein
MGSAASVGERFHGAHSYMAQYGEYTMRELPAPLGQALFDNTPRPAEQLAPQELSRESSITSNSLTGRRRDGIPAPNNT